MGLLPLSLFGMKKTWFSPRNSMLAGAAGEHPSPLRPDGPRVTQPTEPKQARARQAAKMNFAARPACKRLVSAEIGAIVGTPFPGARPAHFLWPARRSLDLLDCCFRSDRMANPASA